MCVTSVAPSLQCNHNCFCFCFVSPYPQSTGFEIVVQNRFYFATYFCAYSFHYVYFCILSDRLAGTFDTYSLFGVCFAFNWQCVQTQRNCIFRFTVNDNVVGGVISAYVAFIKVIREIVSNFIVYEIILCPEWNSVARRISNHTAQYLLFATLKITVENYGKTFICKSTDLCKVN